MAKFDDLLGSLDDQEKQKQAKADKANQLDIVSASTDKVVNAVDKTTEGLNSVKGEVKVTNPDLAKSQDVAGAVEAINKLNLTAFMQNEGLPQLADNLSKLSDNVQSLQDKYQNEGLSKLSDQLGTVVAQLKDVSKTLSNTKVQVDSGLQKTIDGLKKSIDAINFKPSVNVSAPETRVVTTPVDFGPVITALGKVEKAVSAEVPDTEVDLGPVTEGLTNVQNAIQALRFPIPNYVSPFVSATGKDTQVKLGDDGSLPITASISTGALATSANQTNGNQITQIQGSGGGVATVTGGKLDVNATASLAGTSLPISGASTAVGVAIVDSSGNQISSFGGGTQYTDAGTPPTHPIGPTLEWNNAGTWATVGSASPLPVSLASVPSHPVTNAGTFAVQATLSAETTKVIGTVNQGTSPWVVSNGGTFAVQATLSAETTKTIGVTRTADGSGNLLSSTTNALDVNIKSGSIPSGSNVIGHVITDTGSTTAVTGTVTISGAVTEATLDAALISQEATTSGVKGLTVFGAVTTNAPTYTTAKSDALSLDTSGLLRVSLKDTPANTNKLLVTPDSVALPANQSVNISQINAVTPLMGNGVTGTGSQRVTIASDNTAFAVNATLSAETTKVLGVVRNADGAGNLLTSNSSTFTAKFGLDTNLLGTLGTAFSTAGKVDVKGADGDVFVRQATASNLNATVVGTGTFVTQSTLAAETTKVIGVVRIADGSGNLLTSTTNALDINIKSGNPTTMTVTQATGTNLHTVVDSGTITAVTAITNALPAGTNLLGKVGIDQTTPGTTNAVSANQGTAAALTAGWPVINAEAADTTGTFTNATQSTSVTASSLNGYANVLISINGTYGTATAVFEGSDDGGTTWYGISEADRSDSNVIESGYTSLTNVSRAWQISNPGWDSVRVRSTAVASGTVNVRISPSAAPTSAGASVSVGTALPTGANVIGGVTQSGTWTDTVTQATASSLNATVVGTGTFSVQTTADVPGTGATNLGKAEDAGHTTGDTGVMALGVRNDTLSATTNTTADYTQLTTDQAGIVITAGAPRALKGRQVTTITSSTAETTILTSVASTFLDIYGLILTNTSATVTKVSIRDATAGGTISVFEVPPTDTRGFMLPLDSAIPQAAVTNNWTAQCGTSVASLEVTVLYVKRV